MKILPLLTALTLLCPTIAQAKDGNDSYRLHYLRGENLFHQDRCGAAIREVDEAIKSDPNRAEAYWLKGKAEAQRGRPEHALACFNQCLKLNPRLAGAYDSRGLANANIGDFKAAVADYTMSIKLDSHQEKAYRRLGDLYAKHEQYGQALRTYSAGIKALPKDADLWRSRGELYAKSNDFKNAIADMSHAVSIEPTAGKHNSRGKIYLRAKQFNLAQKDFRKAIAINPTHCLYYSNLGVALILAGDTKNALAVLNKAVALDNGSAAAVNNRGIAYEKLGLLDKARADFEKAVENDPKLPEYYANHARAALQTGYMEDAADDLAGLNAREIGDIPTLADAAQSDRLVLSEYDKIIKINPRDANNYYNRAIVYFSMGDFANASKDFSRFLRLTDWKGQTPVYATIYQSIALRELKHSQAAKGVIIDALRRGSFDEWGRLLIGTMTGQVDRDHLLDTAKKLNRKSIAHCVLGLKLFADGRTKDAIEDLKWVAEKGDPEEDEYTIARRFLARLNPTEMPKTEGAGASVGQGSEDKLQNARLIVR